MATLTRSDTFARTDVMLRLHGSTGELSTGLERLSEPVVLAVLPIVLPPRCARGGHRMHESAISCVACRALGLWPGLDRRKLGRAAPEVERIVRLAERSSSLDTDTIRGMLMRQPKG